MGQSILKQFHAALIFGSSGLSLLSAENSQLSSLYWVDLNGPLATEWSALQPSFCEEGAANHASSILVTIEGAPESASTTKSTLKPDEPYFFYFLERGEERKAA